MSDFEILNGGQLLEALERKSGCPKLPTSIEAFDRLHDGGLPRGSLVELTGPRSSGRYSIALSALAAATAAGESAAVIDLGDHFDPQQAAQAGAALERMLWLRPRKIKETLACAELVANTGFSLTVLDLPEPVRPAPSAGVWVRLRRACELQAVTILLLSAEPLAGHAADSFLRVSARGCWRPQPTTDFPMSAGDARPPASTAPNLLDGMSISLSLRRRFGAAPGSASLSLPVDGSV